MTAADLENWSRAAVLAGAALGFWLVIGFAVAVAFGAFVRKMRGRD